MKNKLKFCLTLVCGGLALASSVHAAQFVNASTSALLTSQGDELIFSPTYTVSSPETAQSAGLAIRVHYNSSLLEPLLTTGYTTAFQPRGEITADVQDFDADPATDKFFILAWMDVAALWPGNGNLPLTLADSRFKARPGFSGTTHIRTTATATAYNTSFQSTPQLICTKPTVTLTATDTLMSEEITDTGRLLITLDAPLPVECGPLTIGLDITGSAQAGSDYVNPVAVTVPAGGEQAELILTPVDDSESEGKENIIVALQDTGHYQLGATSGAEWVLYDNDRTVLPAVSLAVSSLKVTEGTDAQVQLTVLRSAEYLPEVLDVYLQASGAALSGSDYQALPVRVSIPAGSRHVSLPVALINDSVQENNKNLVISILQQPDYQLGALSSLDILIQDDELREYTSLPVENDVVMPLMVPTLAEWLLFLLGGLLGAVAMVRIHSQKGEM